MNDSPKQFTTNTSETTKCSPRSSPTEFHINKLTHKPDPLCLEYLLSPVNSKSVGEIPRHLSENSPKYEQRLYTPFSSVANPFKGRLSDKQETITYKAEPEPFIYPIKPAWCCSESYGYDTKYFRYDRETPQFRGNQFSEELAFKQVPIQPSSFRESVPYGYNVHSSELVYHQACVNRPIYSFRCLCRVTYLNLVLYIRNKYRF